MGHHDISFVWVQDRSNPMLVTFAREPVARFYSYYDFLMQGFALAEQCLKTPRGLPPMLKGIPGVPRNLLEAARKADDLDMYARDALDWAQNATELSPKRSLQASLPARIKDRMGQLTSPVHCPPPLASALTRNNVKTREDVDEWFERRFHACVEDKMFHVESLGRDTTPNDLAEVLPTMGLDNYMTKHYSGTSVFSYFGSSDHIDDETRLRLAKKALDKFAFVGLTEKYSQHLEMFAHTFGLTVKPAVRRRNKSRKKAERDPELVQRIKQMDYMDEQIYFHAAYLAQERYTAFKGEASDR